MVSIFTNKEQTPTNRDLKKALGDTFDFWPELIAYTKELYPDAREGWHFTSAKYGWSYRVSDRKRVILYLLPRDKFFKVAFVFGQKATDAILQSEIAGNIKTDIQNARVYAEGRGIRIDITSNDLLADIKKLIAIKLYF